MTDPRELVRRGYDASSHLYRRDDDEPGERLLWIEELAGRIPAGSAVLDLGCGCGHPVARLLADRGHRVTGADISEVQIERARQLVPAARFLHADAMDLELPPAGFDAVVCLYMLFHLAQPQQQELLRRIAGWLRPGGVLLLLTGAQEWTGAKDNWLGGTAQMWWSCPDAEVTRGWISDAGLTVTSEQSTAEGQLIFWAMPIPA